MITPYWYTLVFIIFSLQKTIMFTSIFTITEYKISLFQQCTKCSKLLQVCVDTYKWTPSFYPFCLNSVFYHSFLASPTVTRPPNTPVTVTIGDTVILTCEAVGVPTPLISWRLNWGPIGLPPRVSDQLSQMVQSCHSFVLGAQWASTQLHHHELLHDRAIAEKFWSYSVAILNMLPV